MITVQIDLITIVAICVVVGSVLGAGYGWLFTRNHYRQHTWKLIRYQAQMSFFKGQSQEERDKLRKIVHDSLDHIINDEIYWSDLEFG